MDKLTKPTILKDLDIDRKIGGIETLCEVTKTEYIARVAKDASGNAVTNALSHGRSVTILEGDSIIELHPDGRTDIIKKLEKSSVIPKKRVYHL